MLVLSLFPGIGLLDRAFEEAGFCVVRGPDVLWGGDVRDFHPPASVFDGVIGGPPCQSFSPLVNLVRARGGEPHFGDLFPEFERCIVEAVPRWWLCENVRAAPVPGVSGYAAKDFLLDNSWLGEEQERLRRFTFGVRGERSIDLRRWITPAALMLPGRSSAVTHRLADNSDEANGRTRAAPVTVGVAGSRRESHRQRQRAVTGSGYASAAGYSQAEAARFRRPAVTSSDGASLRGYRVPAVVNCHSGAAARPKGGHLVRYRLAEALRLQGLPEDLLDGAPFTAEGKLRAVANGVPLPMGRAIARAVVQALRWGAA
jgi:DNA (cytosine-5)-methyltransferase 1